MLQVETCVNNCLPQHQKLEKKIYSKLKVDNNNKFDTRTQTWVSFYLKRMFQKKSRKTFASLNEININHFRGSK